MRPPSRSAPQKTRPQAGKVQPTRQDAHCRRGRAIDPPHPAEPIGDFSARTFAAGTAPGARVITDPRPARPRSQGRRPTSPSRADVDPSCVLEPEALGARPSMACAAPICAATSTSSCSAGAAATPQRLSTPCSASARASPADSAIDNAADPGRPGASHRPPSASIDPALGPRNQLSKTPGKAGNPDIGVTGDHEGRPVLQERDRGLEHGLIIASFTNLPFCPLVHHPVKFDETSGNAEDNCHMFTSHPSKSFDRGMGEPPIMP